MRKGYAQEYAVKKKLGKVFGKEYVIKVAIGQQTPDFIVLKPLKFVEVKSTKKKKYYPTKHDKLQFSVFEKWRDKTDIDIEYWIKTSEGWEKMSFYSYGMKYIPAFQFRNLALIYPNKFGHK